MQMDIIEQLQTKLHETFGFNEFRPGQLEAITALIQQGRLLCIQPTGYGKSLLYQLPAVLLDGMTLVISPLLALMRDQITQLKNRFGIQATSFNTDQSEDENRIAKQQALMGKVKILFVAPEQLDHMDKFDFLLRLPISLLVVDEAHCISTWGHDFRPSYRQIIKLAHALAAENPEIKLLGLTATANSKTESDIKEQLTVAKSYIVVHRESMDRPNIRLTVLQTTGMAAKLATLQQILRQLEGSGLIYCATRENTELVAAFLQEHDIKSAAYHAGIDTQRKRILQNDFLEDKYTVIAATNALGMGIDKTNLRFIIHFDFPGSITAYYQEVGRCGRDGLPAEGILLYDPADSKIQKHFIESAQPNRDDFQNVLQSIENANVSPNLTSLKRLTGMHPTKLNVVLAELIEQNFVKKSLVSGSQVYLLTNKIGNPDLTRYSNQFNVRNAELIAMQHYGEKSNICLMETLRLALGDKIKQVCRQCSGCQESKFQLINDKSQIITIASWLSRRTVSITLSRKIKNISTGIAVLDGKLRSADFIQFMRERATSHVTQLGISDNLMELIKDCLLDFAKYHKFSCIIPLPSRTWGAKNAIANLLGNFLNISVLHNFLYWQEQPSVRQGELLNNDQRQHNVTQKMRATLDKKLDYGTILLLDDYIGSGSTLNEACRALRDAANIENEILPFTIAAVKWRLGQKGMV
ncbi:MAG: RecQ family ATP-dependent DNA helicase [Gammaproteobacteria bacterium]